MKKISKILLSFMALFCMVFTCTVNAEETTPTGGNGTLLFTNITKERFDEIVPTEVNVSKTLTYYVNTLIDSDDTLEELVASLEGEVQAQIITAFENESYMDSVEDEKATIKVQMDSPYYDFRGMTISLVINGEKICTKDLVMNYATEAGYKEEDATYVRNQVNSLKFASFADEAAVFTMYNLGDEENADKWDVDTYDFSKLLADNTITVKTSLASGGFGGATPWGVMTYIHFFKNDILYASKLVYNLGAYGVTLENGTPINMATIDKEKDIYKEMVNELAKSGLDNIIGAYELSAFGEVSGNITVDFKIGDTYNGKVVKILHKKSSDNTFETFKTTVVDGKATITVSELSPFVIALTDEVPDTTTTSNNAQTSSMDIVLYVGASLLSLTGITYILVSKKKKEIA